MHGRQRSGSSSALGSQLPRPSRDDPKYTCLLLPAGSSQQPKQSQPLGVSGKQTPVQVCDCAAVSSVQLS